MLKKIVIAAIRYYQKYISPMKPPCCRFIPTCSQYAIEAVEEYGVWKGGLLALIRLSKCQPFHRQKSILYDPIPKYKSVIDGKYKRIPHPAGKKPDVVED